MPCSRAARWNGARATRITKELLDRLEHGDHRVVDRPLVPPAGEAQYAMERTVRSLSDIAEAVGGRVRRHAFPDRDAIASRTTSFFPKVRRSCSAQGPGWRSTRDAASLPGPFTRQGHALEPGLRKTFRRRSAFGTFAVTGDGDTPCIITGLRMSGGTGASAAGQGHSAMLSFRWGPARDGTIRTGGRAGEDLEREGQRRRSPKDCRFSGAFLRPGPGPLHGKRGRLLVRAGRDEREGDAGPGRRQAGWSGLYLEGATDKGMSVGETPGWSFVDARSASAIAMAVKDLPSPMWRTVSSPTTNWSSRCDRQAASMVEPGCSCTPIPTGNARIARWTGFPA